MKTQDKSISPSQQLIFSACDKAKDVLERCVCPIGLCASIHEGVSKSAFKYGEIWARDSMISILGGTLIDNKKIHRALRESIEVLRANQSELGNIPINVHPKTLKIETMNRASTDTNSWYIIGIHTYWQAFHDKELLKKSYKSIIAAITWIRYQDNDGLIDGHEAADWKDLFAVHGAGLYVNVLYYKALLTTGDIASVLGHKKDAVLYRRLAETVKLNINERLWTGLKGGSGWESMKPIKIRFEWQVAHAKAMLDARDLDYYLPFLAFRDFGTWCDTLGNVLAILFDVADNYRSNKILSYFSQTAMNSPYPIKSIYPTLYPGDKSWKSYYTIDSLNFPEHYINGGIWPFNGGFYVAALVKMKRFHEAEEQLKLLAEANKLAVKGEWGFHEWLHGKSGRPNGAAGQAWSASMFLYAHHSVSTRKVPYL